jgi:hypothetical protein
MPLNLRDSVWRFTLNLATHSVYESRSPGSCNFNAAIASSIGAMVVELSRVKARDSYAFWCRGGRLTHGGVSAIGTVAYQIPLRAKSAEDNPIGGRV